MRFGWIAPPLVDLLEGAAQQLRAERTRQSLERVHERSRRLAEEIPEVAEIAAEAEGLAETLYGADGVMMRAEEAARALSVPTLLVRGGLSDLLSEEGARRFLEMVPHAEFRDVSGAGHMVAGDRNDPFTDAVREFLHARRPS